MNNQPQNVYWRYKGDKTWSQGFLTNLSDSMVEITYRHSSRILKRSEIDIEPAGKP